MQNTRATLERLLLRLRPAQLAHVVKRLLGIRRRMAMTREGLRYWADPVSVFGSELLTSGVFEPDLTALLTAVCRPGDVFMDVGGNEGYFSVVAGRLIGPRGAVHCVEPQSRLREVIEENARLNDVRVFVHQVALVAKPGPVELFLRPSTNTGASSLTRHWRLGSASEVVAGITLDQLLEQCGVAYVDVMKVDCEGAESLVVAGGAASFAAARIGILALEHHLAITGPNASRRLHDRLLGWGYLWAQRHDQRLAVYCTHSHKPRLHGLGFTFSPSGADPAGPRADT